MDQIQGRNPNFVNHEAALSRGMTAVSGGSGNRVLVFQGTPGTGKTAAAVEFSFRVVDDFPDGRLLGRLSSSLDRESVEADILGDFLYALGRQEIPDRLDARRALYQGLTAGKRLQVLLDGAMSASQVRTLLPGDGDSLILVTEGRPLSALTVDTPVTFLELSPFTDEAARELLGRLVGTQRVDDEPDAVAEVVRLAGHLPIALCVVGAMMARTPTRTFAAMGDRLRDERRRISALSRNADLSVQAVFTAAYRLLGDTAQRCYRALGLRPRSGQLGVDALAAALDLPAYEVAEGMVELADVRLVDEVGEERYDVRELVQLHAEQLNEQPTELQTARLIEFYHRRVVDADMLIAPARPWRAALFPELSSTRAFPDAQAARDWLRLERPNLLATIAFLADAGEFHRVAQWCVLLWSFYEKDKFLDDLFATHRHGLDAAWRLSNAAVQSLLHTQVGFAHYWLRDLADAVTEFEHGVRLADEVGDVPLAATALEGLGLAELARGNTEQAREALRRNLKLAVTIRDERRVALAKLHLAKAEEPATALALLDEADAEFAKRPDTEVENRAKVLTWRGKKTRSRDMLVSALDVMSARGRRFDQAEILVALGDLAAGDEALGYYREALVCFEDLGFATLAAAVREKINAR
jgi:tetratricopeptide (TPR) repeat protein